MTKLIGCIFALTLVSCSIEQDIKREAAKASQRCEQRVDEMIAEIEEKYEDYCISKEDLLNVLKNLQTEGPAAPCTPQNERDAGFEVPEEPPFPGGF